MIVVDSSAVLAIIFQEPDADDFMFAMLRNECAVSTPILLEMRTVLIRRKLPYGSTLLTSIIEKTDTEILPFTREMADLAGAAFRRFGKGQHPAKLNFGDCMSYAFAKALAAPLLYKGSDFAQPDIRSALA